MSTKKRAGDDSLGSGNFGCS